jgi:hypothetical protein
VDGQISAPAEKRFLNFLDEQTLAADFGQRNILYDIACRFYNFKGYFKKRVQFLQIAFNGIGLPERQSTAACRDNQSFFHYSTAA